MVVYLGGLVCIVKVVSVHEILANHVYQACKSAQIDGYLSDISIRSESCILCGKSLQKPI